MALSNKAKTSRVRIGIVGVGNMGSSHANTLLQNKISRAELTAVADISPQALEHFPGVKHFSSFTEMAKSGLVDAVIIATPHYDHTTIGSQALKAGFHVLVEKPISVHKGDCQKLIAAHKNRKQVFAAMFNQRTDPHFIKLRSLIRTGQLGKIQRINWIITDWFRTETYYASGGWRATWAGEGGGVLLNQCPHNLDLYQWLFGMPDRVRAFCHLGKYHNIEVEDEVTAYMEYNNGATGVLITTTGEAPGTNRLEVAGEWGRVVIEDGNIRFTRNIESAISYNRTSQQRYTPPDTWQISIPAHGTGGQHGEIIQNFVDSILDGIPLIAPAKEGLHSVELANAMLYSSLKGETITLPLKSAEYEKTLKKLIATSKPKKKKVVQGLASDFTRPSHLVNMI